MRSTFEKILLALVLTRKATCWSGKPEHNVDVLDRAGVLGAVLALIAREAHSVRKKRPLSKASADCLQV